MDGSLIIITFIAYSLLAFKPVADFNERIYHCNLPWQMKVLLTLLLVFVASTLPTLFLLLVEKFTT